MKFAFLLYPGVEPIDLAAIGVISMGRRLMPELGYWTVAATLDLQTLANGLRVAPDHDFAGSPPADVLIVPGGPGWEAASRDRELLEFLQAQAPGCTIVSICTGAMILAAAGILSGMTATTKQEVLAHESSPLDLLRRDYPRVGAVSALLVDHGRVVTGGGVSLCIDTMLHLLSTRIDPGKTDELARILEYSAAWQANRQRLSVQIDPNLMRSN